MAWKKFSNSSNNIIYKSVLVNKPGCDNASVGGNDIVAIETQISNCRTGHEITHSCS
jgi:hypothetical protein